MIVEKKDIQKAWEFLRKNENSIPSETLDFIKYHSIKALEGLQANSGAGVGYADAEATLKHIILGGIADGFPKTEKQVDAIAENLFKPETLWCIKMLLQKHSA